MEKKYVLDGTLNGRPVRARVFHTRKDAEQALGDFLFMNNVQVEDDRFPQKHTEEFVCDQYTRFFIRRVIA